MVGIPGLMKEIADTAIEEYVRIASIALVDHSGRILYQTKNWDLSNQTQLILSAIRGTNSIMLNGIPFSIVKRDTCGIVGSNQMGMGALILVPVKGGILVSYVMPGGNTDIALAFLHRYAGRISDAM
jgi:hypothetical protein